MACKINPRIIRQTYTCKGIEKINLANIFDKACQCMTLLKNLRILD